MNIKKFLGLGLILLFIIIYLFLSREKVEFDYNTIDTIEISTNPLSSSSPNITLDDKDDIKTLIQMINDAKEKPILFDKTKGWICNIYIDNYILVLNGSTIKINKSLYRLDTQDVNRIIKFVKDKDIAK
jgi:hypothetical protein